MTKISEALEYYESIDFFSDFESYFADPNAHEKVCTLKEMLEALGDIDMRDDYLKAFIFGLRRISWDDSHVRLMEGIRLLYELFKDIEVTTEIIYTLIVCYRSGPYKLMFKEIQKSAQEGDILGKLYQIEQEAYAISRKEAEKLDYLKEEYDKSFIEEVQEVVIKECLTADKVLDILPSKALIDSSRVEIPIIHYSFLSGEKLVVERLKDPDIEEKYQKTPLDSIIEITTFSSSEIFYISHTSFTKREYEEDLKSKKLLIKKM